MSAPYGLADVNRILAELTLTDPVPGRCPSTMSHCRCGLDPGHPGPHQCIGPRDVPFPVGCLGEWHGNDHDDTLATAHRLPSGAIWPHTCPEAP